MLKRLNIRNDNILLTIVDSLATFIIIMLSWIFFRANTVEHAFSYLSEIFSMSSLTMPEILPKFTLLLIAVFSVIEWMGRGHEYAIAKLGTNWPIPAKWSIYYGIIFLIYFFGGSEQQFIYFQF